MSSRLEVTGEFHQVDRPNGPISKHYNEAMEPLRVLLREPSAVERLAALEDPEIAARVARCDRFRSYYGTVESTNL